MIKTLEAIYDFYQVNGYYPQAKELRVSKVSVQKLAFLKAIGAVSIGSYQEIRLSHYWEKIVLFYKGEKNV